MVWVPLNSKVEILTPKVMVPGGGDSGRSLGHEIRALVVGISAFTKDPSELASYSLPPWDDMGRRCVYEPEGGPSPDTESAGILMLGFPTSRTM